MKAKTIALATILTSIQLQPVFQKQIENAEVKKQLKIVQNQIKNGQILETTWCENSG